MLSHSFAFSRREWIEVAALLADEYRTVAVDLPGFGDASDVVADTMEDMAREMAAVIRALDLDRYVLVGHSMSGKLMSLLASRMGPELGLPHPPEKLVLLTPTPLSREVGSEDFRQSLLALSRDEAGAEEFVTARRALPVFAEAHARAVEDVQRTTRRAWEAWLNIGVYEDYVDRAAPVSVPTLVIAAERDTAWGTDVQKQLTMPHLTDARLITIDSGHAVPIEAPEELATIIREFVDS